MQAKQALLYAGLFASALGIGLLSKAAHNRGGAASQPAIANRESPEHEEDAVKRQPAMSSSAPTAEAPNKTKREILAQYWGANWPVLEKTIEAQVEDLDSIPAESLLPWEEVEAQAREAVLGKRGNILRILHASFPVEVTDDYIQKKLNPEGKELTPDRLAELHAVADTFEAELGTELERALAAETAYRRRIWDEGLYAVGPFSAIPGSAPSQRIQEMGQGALVNFSSGGWEVTLRVDPAGDPDYAIALDRTQQVVDARREALRRQISYY